MARAARRLTPRDLTVERVWAEGILLAGGGRALLLQIADPAVAEGVARHSDVGLDPVRRLTGTLEYLYVLAFGSDEERSEIARGIADQHRAVRGEGDPRYDARDPALQLWVTATLYDTTVRMSEAVRGPLPRKLADELYERAALVGTALGMPAADWPRNREAFAEYWDRRVGGLRVTPTARALSRTLLRPERAPLWLAALMPLARLITAGLLPEAVRTAYGVRWDAARQRRFERRLTALVTLYRLVPRPLQELPSRLLLRRYRARRPGGAGR